MQRNPMSDVWTPLTNLPITAPTAVGKVTISYRTNGSFVEMYIANGAYTNNSDTTVATIPTGLEPKSTIFVGLTESTGYVRVQNDGNIQIKCPSAYGRAYAFYSCK